MSNNVTPWLLRLFRSLLQGGDPLADAGMTEAASHITIRRRSIPRRGDTAPETIGRPQPTGPMWRGDRPVQPERTVQGGEGSDMSFSLQDEWMKGIIEGENKETNKSAKCKLIRDIFTCWSFWKFSISPHFCLGKHWKMNITCFYCLHYYRCSHYPCPCPPHSLLQPRPLVPCPLAITTLLSLSMGYAYAFFG